MGIREIELTDIPHSLGWEELQRIEKGPYFAVKKFAVKRKVISFETEDGDQITFQRGVRQKNLDDFIVTVRKEIAETQRCSLGGYHKTGKVEHQYIRFHMEWDHVQAFVEWINSGSWSQVRVKKEV